MLYIYIYIQRTQDMWSPAAPSRPWQAPLSRRAFWDLGTPTPPSKIPSRAQRGSPSPAPSRRARTPPFFLDNG